MRRRSRSRKWNPFSPDVPADALLVAPRLDSFCWRVEKRAVDVRLPALAQHLRARPPVVRRELDREQVPELAVEVRHAVTPILFIEGKDVGRPSPTSEAYRIDRGWRAHRARH